MSTVDSINDQVHHKLATSANQVGFYTVMWFYISLCLTFQMAQCVGEFGGACDHLLMKYRKDIIRKFYQFYYYYNTITVLLLLLRILFFFY